MRSLSHALSARASPSSNDYSGNKSYRERKCDRAERVPVNVGSGCVARIFDTALGGSTAHIVRALA
jgi:hypothetical protein